MVMPPKTPAPPIDPLAAEIILAARKNPQAVLRAVETERLRRRFHPFVRAAWEALHPGSAFCDGWHIQAVCEHLEAVSRGEIQNLLVNMPPGTLKSTIIAVMWPAWQWATDPSLSWIFASYAHALSKRDSVACRQLIESEWYRSRWGPGFALAEDQNEKMLYGTDKGGFRLATSLGSGVTGHHAARLILDDPLDARNAHSETERQSANDWIDQSWYNRDLGPGVTRRVVVMQRLHMDDPTAHLLSQGNWVHLSLPMEYEPRTWVSPIGWSDPRKTAGEPLWPAMFPSESLAEYKAKGDAYWCTPGETPILMHDWNSRCISEVQAGDSVVGFEQREGEKLSLKKSVVLQVSSRIAHVVELQMESGRTVLCTPEHRWFTGRTPRDESHPVYAKPKIGRALQFLCPPTDSVSKEEEMDWRYLAGLVDGEGHVTGVLTLCQGLGRNLPVAMAMLEVLDRLGLKYVTRTRHISPKHQPRIDIVVHEAASVYRRLIRVGKAAKSQQMLNHLMTTVGRLSRQWDKVRNIRYVREDKVYALTTTTGNYVAWGYLSSNSGQYQQRPFPKGGGYFQVAKLRPNIIRTRPINTLSCRAWDFAATTRETSKRSAGVRMSKDHLGKIYVEHIALGKWATDERNAKMRAHADADGEKVLFEQEGGSAGVDQALAVARLLEGHAVEGIHPSGDKLVRADPYASQVNAGNVWLVDDGTWDVEAYIAELEACPNGSYWDQIDASSMAYSWLAARRVPDAPGAKALSRESPRPPSDWRDEAGRMGAMPADDWRDRMPRA